MQADVRLFLARWLANPGRVVAPYPSSPKLSGLIAAKALRSPFEVVLELGAGTGAVSRALVRAGLPQDQLVMIELDGEMCGHLRAEFPGALVLEGDALRPSRLVPEAWRGRITSCVSGVPLLHYSLAEQRRFIEDSFGLMNGQPRLLQYSNSPLPPLPHRELGLRPNRLGFAWSGIFPHYIWEFTPA